MANLSGTDAQYATQAQLTSWLGQTPMPAEADRLLQRASDLLDWYLIPYRYHTDVNQMPTDQEVIDAFADAVCAQVEWWMAKQDELGEMEQFATMTFEGVSLSRGALLSSRVAPRARERLQRVNANFLARGVIA
jgi:hypothetical protein